MRNHWHLFQRLAATRRIGLARLAGGGLGLLLLTAQGCGTPLAAGRANFRAGRFEQAEQAFSRVKPEARDQVLYHMERGTVRQAAGWLAASTEDYLAAYDELKRLETYSVSSGGASLVINDNVQPFRGAPFERSLLHVMTALNHLGRGRWDEAAVEARRLLASLDPEQRGDFPEDAFSRYVAGLCFELQDDPSNAALQYRLANELIDHAEIEPETGRLRAREPVITPPEGEEPPPPPPWPAREMGQELVVLIMLGRSPSGAELSVGSAGFRGGAYAEIWDGETLLGRSYLLTDVGQLAIETERKLALIKAAKEAARLAIKEGIAQAIEHNSDDVWGSLARLILLGLLDQPDIRRWETLPGALHVARVPVARRLETYSVVIKNFAGATLSRTGVDFPLQHRRGLSVSWYWDLPARPVADRAEERWIEREMPADPEPPAAVVPTAPAPPEPRESLGN
ncbi:MAG: hypothetical protein K9N49_01185 [Candidatus Marinimicrobia bacterium]|nr:hypothetical protein [Candidatus Neomarinimicrobiota bacterium]